MLPVVATIVVVVLVTAALTAALVVRLLGTRLSAGPQPDGEALVERAARVASATMGEVVAAGAREMDVRSRSFEQQVAHIGDALSNLGTVVADLQKERAAQTGSLVAQLEQVSSSQRALAAHTQDLRAALASPKQRGQWGERMAEDVLAAAGLKEGVSFHRQRAIAGGTIPDFRFVLPQDLELRMDVKFPVDNYLRALDADTDRERGRYSRAFVADVRSRIRELSGRGYIDPRDTVDCMLLFIPNEAVYAFLHDADPEVIDVALGHKVVLCSPATLFAVLAVVRRSVEQFRLERTSDEILRCLGGVTAEWEKFTCALDKVAKQLDTVHRSFHDDVNGTRRRVLQRTLDEVDGLAANSSSSGDALAARKASGDVRPLPLGDDAVAEAG